MLEFIKFGNYNCSNESEKQEITRALLNCNNPKSLYYWINIIYNNYIHFNNSRFDYNIILFLKELEGIAKSKTDKIIIMGGIHDDGHTSGLIMQDDYLFVSDNYIRFKIQLKYPRKLYILNEFKIFHFIINVPKILNYNPCKIIYIYAHILNMYIPEEYTNRVLPKYFN